MSTEVSGKKAPDWENQERLDSGQFGLKGDEPMSKKVTGCRLPQRIEDILTQHFDDKDKSSKSDWLRRVLTEAVERELSHD